MSTIKNLRVQHAAKKSAMKAMTDAETDDAPMSPEDVASFEKLNEACKDLEARLARLRAVQDSDADDADEKDEDTAEDAEKRWAPAPAAKTKAFAVGTPDLRAKNAGDRAGEYAVGMWMVKEHGLSAARDHVRKHFGDELVAKALTTGQPIIPQEFNSSWIELLQAKAVIRSMGPTVYGMPYGNMTIPRQNLGSTGSFFGEAQNISTTQLGFDNIQLSWHKYGALTYCSREMLEFSPLDAASIISNDLTSRLALLEDRTFINSPGSTYTPKGLISSVAAGNVLTNTQNAAGHVDFQTVSYDLQAMELALTGNLVEGTFAWIMHPGVVSFLKQLSSTFGVFPFAAELSTGMLNGHKVHTTTQLPTNLGASNANQTNIVLVAVQDMIIGDAYRFNLAMSDQASFQDGTTTVSTFGQDLIAFKATNAIDFKLMHDVSASVLQASGWSISTVGGIDSYTGQAADTSPSTASSASH